MLSAESELKVTHQVELSVQISNENQQQQKCVIIHEFGDLKHSKPHFTAVSSSGVSKGRSHSEPPLLDSERLFD